jgi:hypothetical protein
MLDGDPVPDASAPATDTTTDTRVPDQTGASETEASASATPPTEASPAEGSASATPPAGVKLRDVVGVSVSLFILSLSLFCLIAFHPSGRIATSALAGLFLVGFLAAFLYAVPLVAVLWPGLRRWKRANLITPGIGAASAATALVLALLQILPGEAPNALSTLVDYSGDNFNPCQKIVISDGSKPVSPIPQNVHDGENDGDDIQAWRKEAGGVDAESSHIRVTIQGTTEEAVVLRAMHVRIRSRLQARGSAVYVAGDGCGGNISQRLFNINLDDPTPGLRAKSASDGGREPPSSFPFRVSSNDVEVFLIDANAIDCDCAWELELDWSKGSEKGSTIVNDNGRPFRTQGVPSEIPVYYASGEGGWRQSRMSQEERVFLATNGWIVASPAYKPREAVLSGDSTFAIEDMKWTTWNAYSAINAA